MYSPRRKRGRIQEEEEDPKKLISTLRKFYESLESSFSERVANAEEEEKQHKTQYKRKREELVERESSLYGQTNKKQRTLHLIVGGAELRLTINRTTESYTLFDALLESRGKQPFIIDRDPTHIQIISEYVSKENFAGLKGISKEAAASIAREAEFYGLPGLRRIAFNCTSLVVSQDKDTPYTTIGTAVAAAVSGDRIVILPGRYEECIFTTKRLEFYGEGAKGDIVITTTENHPTVVFSGSGGGALRNLTLRETSPFGICLMEAKGKSSVMIDHCDLSSRSPGNGINMVDEASLHLLNSKIHDIKGSGVFLRDSATATVRNCSFDNLDSCGLFTRHHTRFYFEGNTVSKANLGGADINDFSLGTIDGNTVTDCGRGGLVFYGNSQVRIKGNTIVGNEYGMRSFENSHQLLNGNTVEDNLVEDIQGTALKNALQEEATNSIHLPVPNGELEFLSPLLGPLTPP
eukprot:TRINITY_DN1072_c2_g4_i1.p1 TRINITY_DN1072_c2_g4~~TRINITY_DN1072_c2_g4_i1.p1  ORF type:complete len:475 (+),score=49.21 TRINITY_DN1072_c2_g4_i1:37-1425(+)